MKIIIDNNIIPTDAIVKVYYIRDSFEFRIFLIGGTVVQISRDSHFNMMRPEEFPKYPTFECMNYKSLMEEYINHPLVKKFEDERNLTREKNINEIEQLYNAFMIAWEPEARFLDIKEQLT
jgi:hypothetical protein